MWEILGKLASSVSSIFQNKQTIETTQQAVETNQEVHQQTDEELLVSVLRRLSYDIDDNRVAAVKKFQKNHGLRIDGDPAEKTMAVVRKLGHKIDLLPVGIGNLVPWRMTVYYVAAEEDYGSDNLVPVYDKNKKKLCSVNASFFCNAALEGTGKLRDGRLLNVAGKPYNSVNPKDYEAAATVYRRHCDYMASKGRTPRPSRYFGVDVVDGKVTAAQAFNFVSSDRIGKGYGTGRKGISHDPWRTIATDVGAYPSSYPKYRNVGGLWPSGTPGCVLDLVGEVMHDGTVHDGMVMAADTGGGIFGRHLDMFTGTKGKSTEIDIPNNAVGYVWFQDVEKRIPISDEYGLYDRR